jgi:S-formylglutathione hydrolase
MYSYVTEELPAWLAEHFPANLARQSIFGHSMGGHGALVAAFREPERYRSVSAFAPIAAPMQGPWGKKAFSGYLGDDREAWKQYDASELARTTRWKKPVLVDQGSADEFLERELMPEKLESACQAAGIPLSLNRRSGYDHSYSFIATFVADHIAHHARALNA